MLDGIMMNELSYGTMQLGQRFPIENIEKIEILRGPASITNGGLVSYGVLNKSPKSTRQNLKFLSALLWVKQITMLAVKDLIFY